MHTETEVQQKLKDDGFDPGPIDGVFGVQSLTAYNLYRSNKGEAPVAPFQFTLASVSAELWPPPPSVTPPNILDILKTAAAINKGDFSMIPASAIDYAFNFISSKINWFAGAMAVAIIGFLNTKFGLNIDSGTTAAITTLLVTIMTGGVWLLRTFFNKPTVVSGQVVAKT